jgi:predicted oxidoreductase (fatty acid repression mutant protein)
VINIEKWRGLAMEFKEVLKTRRSLYELNKDIGVSDEVIKKLLGDAVLHTPSGYNSQGGRIVLLLNEKHDLMWTFTKEALRKALPPERFKQTEIKLDMLGASYGTILFFEDQTVVKGLMEQFPRFQNNFPKWALEASGMLQFVVWSSLADIGIGASLQHYNELIETEVKAAFDIPEDWLLLAQMPFGHPFGPAREKTFLPLEGRLLIKD